MGRLSGIGHIRKQPSIKGGLNLLFQYAQFGSIIGCFMLSGLFVSSPAEMVPELVEFPEAGKDYRLAVPKTVQDDARDIPGNDFLEVVGIRSDIGRRPFVSGTIIAGNELNILEPAIVIAFGKELRNGGKREIRCHDANLSLQFPILVICEMQSDEAAADFHLSIFSVFCSTLAVVANLRSCTQPPFP
jgi:hypothetical protein